MTTCIYYSVLGYWPVKCQSRKLNQNDASSAKRALDRKAAHAKKDRRRLLLKSELFVFDFEDRLGLGLLADGATKQFDLEPTLSVPHAQGLKEIGIAGARHGGLAWKTTEIALHVQGVKKTTNSALSSILFLGFGISRQTRSTNDMRKLSSLKR